MCSVCFALIVGAGMPVLTARTLTFVRQFSNALILLAVLASVLSGTLFAGRNQWTPVGPEGGVVSALAADPRNPSTLYAATCGGVFKTPDGGANWRPVNSGLGEIDCSVPGLGTLAVDPLNTGTVYAVSGNQIFKTTDGGARWSAVLTLKAGDSLRVVLIAPSDPNTVYASGDPGIFKSTDGGISWAGIVGSGATGSCCSNLLAVDPQRPATLYASFCCPGDELLKSTDGGVSWNPANSGLPGIQALAINPQHTDILYAGNRGQTFKSTDGGTSWNPANSGLPPPLAPSAGYSDVLSVTVNPQNPAVVYALIYQALTAQGRFSYFLATSTDGAASWTVATDPQLSAVNLRAMLPDPQDVGTLYVGTSNGVLKTADGGGHWNLTNSGLRAVGVESVVADSQTPGVLFAASDCCAPGVFKSADGGGSWAPASSGLPSVSFGLAADADVIPGLIADPQQPGTLYALDATDGRLFRSQDDGASWSGIWSHGSGSRVGPLAIASRQSNVMYAGITSCNGSCYNHIARSSDGGHTWTDSQATLTGTRGAGEPDCCGVFTSVVVDPQNANIVYAGLGDDLGLEGSLWKSTDGGISWASLINSNLGIVGITTDPQNPGVIYVLNYAGSGALSKSVDGGQTWVYLDLADCRTVSSCRVPAGPVVIDPHDSATLYSMVYDHGSNGYDILRSADAGASWADVGPRLRGSINSLTVDPQDPRTLYAGTSAGLFAITQEARMSRRGR
jgi:photosystem II stability/assembly factor-like uncharacterized protein